MRHLCSGPVEQLAIMIAADVDIARAHQGIRGGGRLQRSRKMVSQVHNQIRRILSQIRPDGFERPEIAVDISQ